MILNIIMGMIMSYMGGTGDGLASQALSFVSGTLYDRFIKDREITDFDAFHTAILDIFNAINMALPGKHYDAPTHKEIEDLFERWNKSKDDKKNIFSKFILENVNKSRADESMMITGIVAPPAAMVAKRTGQSLPQLSVLKAIPDVAFVPSATILALIVVKLTKRMSFKNMPS